MGEVADIDALTFPLHERAQSYAKEAEALASDPYFREAVVKSAVSSFVWALYDAFDGDAHALAALHSELEVQKAAVGRAIEAEED